VTGGIDPTYLALTPQASDPLPAGLDGMWIETGGSLRVQKMRMDDFSSTTAGYIDINPITNPQITLSDGITPTELNVVTLNNNEISFIDSSGTGTTTSFTTSNLSQITTGPTTITATWEDIINNTNAGTPTLQQVLDAGNEADLSIILKDGLITPLATNTIDDTGVIITETAGVFGVKTNTINKIGYEVREDDGLGHYQEVELQQDNLSFYFNQPSLGYDFDMVLSATTGGGLCGIQHTDRSSTIPSNLTLSTNQNLVFTADNIDLSSSGQLVLPSLASGAYLRYNPTTANELLYSNSATAGGGSPMLSLFQDNATAGSCNLRLQKNTSTTGSPLGEIAFYGRDATAGNPYREFCRIRSAIRNNTAPTNIDGSLDLFALVNGTLTELMRINGQNSEIEFYQPIDTNGNNVNCSTGDLNLTASASATTGNVNITAKTGSVVNINSNVVMDNSETLMIRNTANTIYNSQSQSSVNLIDITNVSNTYSHQLTNTQQLFINQQINTYRNESNAITNTITETDSLSVDIKKLTLETNLVRMTDFLSPNTEQVDITPTSLQFTSSGSASDSLSMYNDSADGGEIDWTNTTGINGLTITSSHSLTLKSTTATYPIQLDSDVINLQNTNTTASTAGSTSVLATTSAIGDITNYLKLQLNGADIWIPYFTSDPSV
jgi:hypothetical protein